MKTRPRLADSPVVGSVILAAAMIVTTAMMPPPQTFAGSIFDDDWMSGKSGTLHPATGPSIQPTTAPTNPVVPPNPSTPTSQVPLLPTTVPPTSLEIVRRAVPKKQDLEHSRSLLKDAFAEQLADHSLVGRHKLAETLLIEAAKAGGNPPDQFAMFGGALNSAKESANLRLVVTAADEMAKVYLIDGAEVKMAAAMSMPLKAESPQANHENVLSGLELMDSWIAADEVAAAVRLCELLRPLAVGDPALMTIVQKRQQNLDLMRTARTRITPALEKLKTAPDDAAANSTVGAYRCFYSGNWPMGLAMLAKGSDPELKKLAVEDLANPSTPEAQIKLADGWWNQSDKQGGPAQTAIRQHAAAIYSACTGTASPLQKIKIDKRIADAATANASNIAAADMIREANLHARLSRLKEFVAGFAEKPGTTATAIPIGDPLEGQLTWTPTPGGSTLAGDLFIGFNSGNNKHKFEDMDGNLKVEAGYHLEGGFLRASKGRVDLLGESGKPIVFRHVHVGCELTAHVKASYVIFDNCTFSKDGGFSWIGSPSAKFQFDHCLLLQSNFAALGFDDYGIQLKNCTFVSCKFPGRDSKLVNQDSYKRITHEWSRITSGEFVNCEIPTSVLWLTQQCNFANCKITDKAIYASETPLPVVVGVQAEERAKLLADLKDRAENNSSGHVTFTAAEELFTTETWVK